MFMIPITKSLLMLATSLYFFLVAIGNIFDYDSNFQFVKHVLLMDTTFPGNKMLWRAINIPLIHHAFYLLIIVWELAVAGLSLVSGIRLFKYRKNEILFHKSVELASLSCAIGMLLWFGAFMTIGGEWFLMWQSDSWNGLSAAARIFSVQGIILLYLNCHLIPIKRP